uniref:Uncharacterized protein n=1 Tax=Aegilops tauschii TaxID=37682 RepID=R7WFW7_AEGTA
MATFVHLLHNPLESTICWLLRYLYKRLNGEWGKEMDDMGKKLHKCVERIDEKIEAIRDA